MGRFGGLLRGDASVGSGGLKIRDVLFRFARLVNRGGWCRVRLIGRMVVSCNGLSLSDAVT